MGTSGWQFWIDRGGTFTDIVAADPSDRIHALKLLSEDPAHYDDAAIEGIRRLLRNCPDGTKIDAVKMGTTVATNALLERKGEPTVLVITAGLSDAIQIGSQQRPDIFALDIMLPELIYCDVVEADERCGAHGEIVLPLDEQALRERLAAIHAKGIESAAIVFLHGYRYTRHEELAAKVARSVGFKQISVSHEVSPLMKIVPRGDTTLVDAYLSPVLRRYVDTVESGLEAVGAKAQLLFMQSHGGLTDSATFRGKDSILSGPAGGIVGMARTAQQAGFDRVIGFDMGGTSTDVALFDGTYERTSAALIGGVRVTSPMMKIHTVASGGGSIVKFTQQRLVTGPESAGAQPGPACYRNGGPLTITDANVHLGRIQSDFFPHVFGPDADLPIDAEIVQTKFAELAAEIGTASGARSESADVAAGCLRISVERMANAIKQISVRQGHDLRDFTLCSFGGAGGQHACLVADALGIKRILIHPLAGVLSAYGMGLADIRIIKQQSLERQLGHESFAAALAMARQLEREASAELGAQHAMYTGTRIETRFNLKPAGSDTSLTIGCPDGASVESLLSDFEDAHHEHYGFESDSSAPLIDSIELELIGEMPAPRFPERTEAGVSADPVCHRRAWFDGTWREVPIFRRTELSEIDALRGPAIIVEENATTIIETGWMGRIDPLGNLLLERIEVASNKPSTGPFRSASADAGAGSKPDPLLLEVFNNAFMHVAEQMGIVLANTAHSVNIKERMDFSCAIFDPNGDLIANAPHMPVHLGSMGESVRTLLQAHSGSFADGDVYMTNAPYSGGTHLPDITVVTPILARGALQFAVASRAHHADIGGSTPGSMPPASRSIFEEGLMFDDVTLVRNGRFLEAEIYALLTDSDLPARNPKQNIADLKAQIAANSRGVVELQRLVRRHSLSTVRAYMSHIMQNAEDCVRRVIGRLSDGTFELRLDNGERIVVSIEIDRKARTARVDFAGTSPTSRTNFNAPGSIAKSAVIYVFRSLVEDDIPLNAGCLKPISIVLPENSLVNPKYPAPVVGGNVETSQCITDALFAAFGLVASSQGTMNNFTFGNERYQYYETLCGGAGATFRAPGASAVHTHMTNSRLTDPEVLEWRFPVRLRRFEVRRGSGGSGLHRGGDGIIRDIEFLESMEAAVLSNRRSTRPFGINGGEDGAAGRNYVMRAGGTRENLGGIAHVQMCPGDRFVIETPGGGGFGRRPSDERSDE